MSPFVFKVVQKDAVPRFIQMTDDARIRAARVYIFFTPPPPSFTPFLSPLP